MTNNTETEQTVEAVNKEKDFEAEYKILEDKYLRLYSDFENHKKRVARDREDSNFNTKRNIFSGILPTIDDLDRVLSSGIIDLEGLKIIKDSFTKNLSDHGLEKIPSIDSKFNPDHHDAIATSDMGTDKKGIIVDEMSVGYTLNGKLVRPSKVVVGA